jgi:hypothetical protein
MPELCETGTPFAMSGLRCFGSMNTTTRAFDVSDTGRDRYVSWRWKLTAKDVSWLKGFWRGLVKGWLEGLRGMAFVLWVACLWWFIYLWRCSRSEVLVPGMAGIGGLVGGSALDDELWVLGLVQDVQGRGFCGIRASLLLSLFCLGWC